MLNLQYLSQQLLLTHLFCITDEKVPILCKLQGEFCFALFSFWNQQGGAKYKVAASMYIYIDIYILKISMYI